jgi:cytochrome c peroxidase
MKRQSLLILLILLSFASLALINLNEPDNYSEPDIPNYIIKDNMPESNRIDDRVATLGRVLFYDKQLSRNGTVSCASCHKQEFAFGDTAVFSRGLEGELTGRHSMRLANIRFADDSLFFWDRRAASLEIQTTMPIQDHVEMGFSGFSGDPGMDSLLRRLEGVDYYPMLFEYAFGDDEINELRMQKALAQFVRSIVSFDSKFDEGRAITGNNNMPFPNFTQQENQGKMLFFAPPAQGGGGCQGCHRAPEFDIDPNTGNNGIIAFIPGTTNPDFNNTRSPSLRDLYRPDGILNGPMMHTGHFRNFREVIDHYNIIVPQPSNPRLDPRLRGPQGAGQQLNFNETQKAALEAFMRTLSGQNLYTDPKWSNPFNENGELDIIPLSTSISEISSDLDIKVWPNPTVDMVQVQLPEGEYTLKLFELNGKLLQTHKGQNLINLNLRDLQSGIYLLQIQSISSSQIHTRKIVKK